MDATAAAAAAAVAAEGMVDAVPPAWTLATDSLILLASMAVWLLLGWAFVIHFLFRNHEIRHTLVQVFFAGTFCLGRPGGGERKGFANRQPPHVAWGPSRTRIVTCVGDLLLHAADWFCGALQPPTPINPFFDRLPPSAPPDVQPARSLS